MAATATATSTHKQQHQQPPVLAGYLPSSSQVLDLAKLDLDQKAIQDYLLDAKLYAAQRIYRLGAYSKTYSQINVTTTITFRMTSTTVTNVGLPQWIPEGTKLIGMSTTGLPVHGRTLGDTPPGSTILNFQYDVVSPPPTTTSTTNSAAVGDDNNDNNQHECHVGGLPNDQYQLSGCLAETGGIQVLVVKDDDDDVDDNVITNMTVSYTYDTVRDTVNARTLAALSTTAKAVMHDCETCPYKTYETFFQYYGTYDYGHQIIMAALETTTTSTTTTFRLGNHDFSHYDELERADIVVRGIVYLNVWMYTIHQMELAVDYCQDGNIGGNDNSVSAWDDAVALYVGSLEGTDGRGDGVLLYDLADTQCVYFRTCGESTNLAGGTSSINIQSMRAFKAAQNDLRTGECNAAKLRKDEIERLMAVPLMQGTLRYAYIRNYELIDDNKQDAAGAIFAAAILPLIHACGEKDAQVIYDNMRAGLYHADFPNVKRALEANYQCLSISCTDIGGIWSSKDGRYYEGAAPCSDATSTGLNVGAIIGGILAGILGVVLLIVMYMKCTGRSCGGGGCGASGKDNAFVADESYNDPVNAEDVGVPEQSPVEQVENEREIV